MPVTEAADEKFIVQENSLKHALPLFSLSLAFVIKLFKIIKKIKKLLTNYE